jgi:hypothetical protein
MRCTPVRYAHEVHVHDMHVYEVHAHEVHAREVHACKIHVYEVHVDQNLVGRSSLSIPIVHPLKRKKKKLKRGRIVTRQGFEPWRFAPEQLNHLPDGQDKLDYQVLVFTRD